MPLGRGLREPHASVSGEVMTTKAKASEVNETRGRGAAATAPQGPAAESDLTQVLTDLTRGLEATVAQLTRLADAAGAAAPSTAAALPMVNIYGDDPFSEASPTQRPPARGHIAVPFKGLTNSQLRIKIEETAPPLAQYAPGTPDFRYWSAAEALARGIAFWSDVLPQGTTWSAPNPMPVVLVAPKVELNAYYSRSGLRFHQAAVGGTQIFAAHSADVVCHELGHAILDALKPQLFNAGIAEGWAFHEAFGDISALLSALELDWMCEAVLQETGGRLSASSRWSRLAESLGWGLRQMSPSLAEADCLRNAVNRFAYRQMHLLLPEAPPNMVSRQPHSFSRVFTGAFFEVLTALCTAAGPPDVGRLRQATREAARLLVAAVLTAPIAPDYFGQVAAAMIQADQALNEGRNRAAFNQAFTERGILSVQSVLHLASASVPQVGGSSPFGIAATVAAGSVDLGALHLPGLEPETGYRLGFRDTPELPIQPVSLNGIEIGVHLPVAQRHFAIAPLSMGPGSDEVQSSDASGRLALEELIRGGHLELTPSGPSTLRGILPEASEERPPRVTHQVVTEDGQAVLRRIRFQCCPCTVIPRRSPRLC